MLFNVLFVVFVIYVMASPYFLYKAMKFGMDIDGEPPEVVFHLPKKKKTPKMTDDEKRTMQILQNIDRYDGTSNGQKEIK